MKDDRRLLRLVIVVLAVVGTATTTGRTDAYGYDVRSSAPVSVLAPSGPEGSSVQTSVTWEQPISPSVEARGTSTTLAFTSVATNTADDLVDLASPARRTHILDRDATGGGHRWPGASPDKTPFPQGWSDDEIMHAVSDVATDPSLIPRNVTGPPGSLKTNAGNPARQEVFGYRNGVCIRVITEPLGEGIITAHPIIGPCPP